MDTYSTSAWRHARSLALARDGSACTVGRLLGGPCSSTLHVHHIEPVADGGERYVVDNLATVCSRHHPRWEALRRSIVAGRGQQPRLCRHFHRTREAREICERRLARLAA